MQQKQVNLYLNEGKSQWEVKDNKLEGNSFKDRAEGRDAEMVHFISFHIVEKRLKAIWDLNSYSQGFYLRIWTVTLQSQVYNSPP